MAADDSPPPQPHRARSEVFPVFVDSNLDTHLAMVVSSTDTVADFKRNIGIEHALCFPGIGLIDILALKVKRRGALYHLSDSMLVRSAFEGIKRTWLLHADIATTLKNKCEPAKEVNLPNEISELQRAEEESLVVPSSRLSMGNEDPIQSLIKNDLLLLGNDISHNNLVDVQTDLIKSKEENLISQFVKETQPKESETQANELTIPDARNDLVVYCMEKGERQEEIGVPSEVVNNLHASTRGSKKAISRTRVNASNHERKVDENSNHTYIKEKGEDISKKDVEKRVPEDAFENKTEGYSEDPLLREDAVKLQIVPVLDSLLEKETDGVAFPEEQSEGASNIKSMPAQFTDKGKKRKLKSSTKPQDEINFASKKRFRGLSSNKENLDGETEKPKEAKTAGLLEGQYAEGKLEKVIRQQKHLAKEPNTEFTDAISDAINTRTKKFDLSDDIHVCLAINLMSTSASDKNPSFQTTQVKDHEDDLQKVKSKKSDGASEKNLSFQKTQVNDHKYDLQKVKSKKSDGAASSKEGQNNALRGKKRSKHASSKKSLGESAPFNSSEFMDEDNTKEATQNKNGYVLKESAAEKIHGEAAISKISGKADSDMPSDTNVNNIKEQDHTETEFNHVLSKSWESTHPLGGKVNKDKLNGKELPGKSQIGEPVAFGTNGEVVFEAPTNMKGKRSRKRKLSVKDVHSNQEFDAQKESPQCQVKEKDERKQKISADMGHNDLDKESNLAAKLLAGVPGGSPLKPDLTTDPSITSKYSRKDKKKLVKSATSSVTTRGHDLPSTPDNQASAKNLSRPTTEKSGSNAVRDTSTPSSFSPENDNRDINRDLRYKQTNIVKDNTKNTPSNFSKGSFEANDGDKLDKPENDKIDFIGYFSTKPVHYNILSKANLASSDIEAGKQHKDKNKKKRKSSIHPNSLADFVSTKQGSHNKEINPKNLNDSNSNLVNPEKGLNGLVDTESLHDVTVERTSTTNVIRNVSSDLLSSQSPRIRKVKDRIQNYISDNDKTIPLARSNQRDKASLHRPEAKSSTTQGANGIEKLNNKVKQTGKSNKNARTKEVAKDQNLSNSAVLVSNVKALAHQEAFSDDTEQETPIQAKRYRVAVRKAPKTSVDKAFKISDEEKISFASSGTTSSDSSSGSSEGKSDISNRETIRRLESDGSHPSTDSDKDLEDDAGSETSSFVRKNERNNDGDVILSQASNKSMKNVRIGTIFRSTSSYKKAKLLASQSQAEEDPDSQTVDVVLETQPDSY